MPETPRLVAALRERKYRKEQPFALMASDIDVARGLVELSEEAEALLLSTARPIVLAPAKTELPGVCSRQRRTWRHAALHAFAPFAVRGWCAGILVMTSANRSSEPIAYEDEEALDRLSGIADAFLIGERPIARRVDDSVARLGTFGPVSFVALGVMLRARSRPLPGARPILAVGADLKNSVTLVVDGQALSASILETSDITSRFAHSRKRFTILSLCMRFDPRI